MPSSRSDAADSSVACPQLLTPASESSDVIDTLDVPFERRQLDGMIYGAGDNTAHGMAYEQELSMYTSQEDDKPQALPAARDEGDKEKAASIEDADSREQVVPVDQPDRDTARPTPTSNVSSIAPSPPGESDGIPECDVAVEVQAYALWKMNNNFRNTTVHTVVSSPSTRTNISPRSQASSPATQISDDKPFPRPTSSYPSTPAWDFTNLPLPPHYPSSLLRPGSTFTGSQQSDRQIYNVDVSILTVSTTQSSLTGYLRICGLTEDHPTLMTFFSGEIIGGPSHKYSFRTRTPSWGATDKTDLIHWARFPAWRPLAKEAKRDIDFAFPLDGTEWWQQENVYMRWKEHFLVPDHRVRSIAGASFEGFYYATFNQVEGRISGIYFHAKSERYQQLELKHVFDKGICPSREFR